MGSSSRTMSSRTSSRTTTTTSSRTQPSTTTTTTTRSQPTTSSFTTKRVDSMLGGYGAKEDEVNALLSKSPEVEEFESKLNTERRLNVKLSDDNSSVQRNLRMVHKLLIDEREALSRILDAAEVDSGSEEETRQSRERSAQLSL